MKKNSYLIVLVSLFCLFFFERTYAVVVDRTAKPVQVDGYLIEWPESEADTGLGTVSYVWDAVNTFAGLTGYIKYSLKDSCNPVFNFIQSDGACIILTAGISDSLLCAVDTVALQRDTSIIYEWVVPWKVLALDVSGRYTITIRMESTCGDSSPLLTLTGEGYAIQKKTVVSRKIVVQLITVFLLLTAFIILQIRARKLYKKKR